MKNIVVDFEAKVITVTSNFAKRAGVAGTPEYHTLVGVMRDFPDYTLRVKRTPSHHTPSPYSKLTYADMEATIMRCEDDHKREAWLDEFNRKKYTVLFAQTKSWFIKNVLTEMPDCHEVA